MVVISAPVGLTGTNNSDDVMKIQELINKNRHRDPNGREIPVDGIVGPKTIMAIKRFQTDVMGMHDPDSRVDPAGKTLRALNGKGANSQPATSAPKPIGTLVAVTNLRFPLRRRPHLSYKAGGRAFGAQRSRGRRHAGCDLIAVPGTEILAVTDGQVIAHYHFYSGTDALEIRHATGFVI